MLPTPKEKPNNKLYVFWRNDSKKHTKFLNDLSFPYKPLVHLIFPQARFCWVPIPSNTIWNHLIMMGPKIINDPLTSLFNAYRSPFRMIKYPKILIVIVNQPKLHLILNINTLNSRMLMMI